MEVVRVASDLISLPWELGPAGVVTAGDLLLGTQCSLMRAIWRRGWGLVATGESIWGSPTVSILALWDVSCVWEQIALGFVVIRRIPGRGVIAP